MILGIIIGILISSTILLCIFIPKLKLKHQIDEDIIKTKEYLIDDINSLNKQKDELKEDISQLNTSKILDTQKVKDLKENIEYLNKHKEQCIKDNDTLINTLDLRFSEYADRLGEQTAQYEEEYKQEYLDTIKDLSNNIQIEMDMIIEERNSLLLELEDCRNIVQAAIDANIRAEELRTKADFYKLQIPYEDLQEIKTLKEVAKLLRNKEPLNKVIWKVYYEKPTNDLIGRVVGEEKTTGIYKITNLNNSKCYIGQAVKYRPMKNFS